MVLVLKLHLVFKYESLCLVPLLKLYQLAAVAFCLLVAWCSDKLGLIFELGSFAAGVMIATTDLAQHTLEQVRLLFSFKLAMVKSIVFFIF
ncbi:hypothetical protein DCAR_0727951 [Daucus carota subsp. sativus]|uniref:Cation/H+ exchanger transmembrane domain-containing protein n=1 Tax=Daucus carota subsp. sativus TaxID=79200 RepID=A0AAF1B700_DAUCS|nr:hypothetical protein DCAR_0727951 [Daucus carota subsp. sativus]